MHQSSSKTFVTYQVERNVMGSFQTPDSDRNDDIATPLKVLQLNYNGIRNKIQEILHFIKKNGIHSHSIDLVNDYITPISSCPDRSPTNIGTLFENLNGFIMGDFNAHHHGGNKLDTRGYDLDDQSDSRFRSSERPNPI